MTRLKLTLTKSKQFQHRTGAINEIKRYKLEIHQIKVTHKKYDGKRPQKQQLKSYGIFIDK